MNPVIFFRDSEAEAAEKEAATHYFSVISQRTQIKAGDLVIPRYSAFPFYKELEQDVNNLGAKLINSYAQHQYVADLKNWYQDLRGMTFPTYFRAEDIPDNSGPLVVKGQTNSRKEYWSTRMYAEDKARAIEIMLELQKDGLLAGQDIYFRKYIPLKTYTHGIGGHPVTAEYRLFFYGSNLLASGYYWSNFYQDLTESDREDIDNHWADIYELVPEITRKVDGKIKFWVADIAITEKGSLILVELNDGSMSGLSNVRSYDLYYGLKYWLES